MKKNLFLLLLLWSGLGAACSRSTPAPDCIDPELARRYPVSTRELNPVCGCDGKTYANPSVARAAGVRTYAAGQCPSGK